MTVYKTMFGEIWCVCEGLLPCRVKPLLFDRWEKNGMLTESLERLYWVSRHWSGTVTQAWHLKGAVDEAMAG